MYFHGHCHFWKGQQTWHLSENIHLWSREYHKEWGGLHVDVSCEHGKLVPIESSIKISPQKDCRRQKLNWRHFKDRIRCGYWSTWSSTLSTWGFFFFFFLLENMLNEENKLSVIILIISHTYYSFVALIYIKSSTQLNVSTHYKISTFFMPCSVPQCNWPQ